MKFAITPLLSLLPTLLLPAASLCMPAVVADQTTNPPTQTTSQMPPAPFVVPIELHHGTIWLDGTLNDKKAHFVLDTGATQTAVSTDAIQRFGLTLDKDTANVHGLGGDITAQFAKEVTIGIGNIKLTGGDAIVVPFPEFLKGRDGIFGSTLFQNVVVTVDYQHRLCGMGLDAAAVAESVRTAAVTQLSSLPSPAKIAPVVPPLPSARTISLPLTLDANGYIAILGAVDGHPLRLRIDSGDGGVATLYAPYVERNHLRSQFKSRLQIATGRGIGGLVYSDVVRVHTLTLGAGNDPTASITFHGVVTELSRQTSGAFSLDDTDGQIGTEILKRFVVTFDYAHSRLLLTPNSQIGAPFTFNRSGFAIDNQGGKFIAAAVVPSGPAAAAGIADGDVVISIDGVPASVFDRADDDVHPRLGREPVGTVLRVVRQRGTQKPVEVKVTLRELLP